MARPKAQPAAADGCGDRPIILDLSRLISRVFHPTPTGVDRCEMAYARILSARHRERLCFAAVHPFGYYGRLPHDAVMRFLDITERRWDQRGFTSPWDIRRYALGTLTALRPMLAPVARMAGSPIYLQASPNNLTRPKLLRSILAREQARFVCLIHDLIPIHYPEYARPDGAALHAQRMETVVELASGIVTNSQATLDSLNLLLARSARATPAIVAHLGTHVSPASPIAAPADERPYFVCIGTIEPRKNHLLLLNIWRRMAEEAARPEDVPRLILIGRRGWENEQVVDMLERCSALAGCVEERSGMPDRQVEAILAGARALLLPSFAEGYGMPVTEALALGVPVLCSDLPALREAGGAVPDYIDFLDGRSWLSAIRDYASPTSAGRSAQLRRMDRVHPRTWEDHVSQVVSFLDKVVA